MNRPVSRRGGQHNDVDFARDQLLISVEPGEAVFRIHPDAPGQLGRHVRQLAERPRQAVFEQVGHRHQLHVGAAGEQILDGLRAAVATADQSGF